MTDGNRYCSDGRGQLAQRELEWRPVELQQLERQRQRQHRFALCSALPSLSQKLRWGGRTVGWFCGFNPSPKHSSDLVDNLLYLRVFFEIDGFGIFG